MNAEVFHTLVVGDIMDRIQSVAKACREVHQQQWQITGGSHA